MMIIYYKVWLLIFYSQTTYFAQEKSVSNFSLDQYTDEKWINLNNVDHSVSFSSLHSGSHSLWVCKADGFCFGNYTDKKFWLIMPPLWYQTWWVPILFLLLVSALVYVIIRIRSQRIVRESQKLETLVIGRTESLQATLDQLKKSEYELSRQLHLQTRLMASITHDIQSPLRFLTYTSKRVHQLVAEKKFDSLPRITDIVASTTETTGKLLEDLLAYTKSKVYEGHYELELVDVRTVVKSKYEIFKSILMQEGNQFVNEVPLNFEVYSDIHLLGIILHNLIDNAAKHTQNSLIRVYVRQVANKQHLIISNTGPGIDAQTIAWFNRPDDGHERITRILATSKSGAGLLIVKEMAALINVQLFIEQTDVTAVHVVFGQTAAG